MYVYTQQQQMYRLAEVQAADRAALASAHHSAQELQARQVRVCSCVQGQAAVRAGLGLFCTCAMPHRAWQSTQACDQSHGVKLPKAGAWRVHARR